MNMDIRVSKFTEPKYACKCNDCTRHVRDIVLSKIGDQILSVETWN